MARAYAIACIVLLLATATPAIAEPLAWSHTSTLAGWMTDRFTMSGERIFISIGTRTTEAGGGIVHLFDGTGRPLRSSTYGTLGGNSPDIVVAGAGAVLGTDDESTFVAQREEHAVVIGFQCNAACNPSREFILATSGAGTNMTSWGYGVFADGTARSAHSAGAGAGALLPRQFDTGTAVHAGLGSNPRVSILGVDVTQGAAQQVAISNSFAGGFLRIQGSAPTTMTLQTPSSTLSCPCSVVAGTSGSYTFRFDNAAASGDEAFAIWADVRLS